MTNHAGSPMDLHYPSPEPDVASAKPLADPPKKKRKAWGQPVPEINPILPPRKRAKTAEEKEQRKNERILRNRRAADKSRQRQKAAVAELEVTKSQMEEENATLRAILQQYRTRFGDIEGFNFSAPSPSTTTESSYIKSENLEGYSAPTPMSYNTDFDAFSVTDSPSIPPAKLMEPSFKASPALTPTLFPPHAEQVSTSKQTMSANTDVFGVEASSVAQYPAVILCGLQCPLETSTPSVSNMEFQLFIQFLTTLHLISVYMTFYSTILSPMSQIFQILRTASPMTSSPQCLSNLVENHITLLCSLITRVTPKTTSPTSMFRTKVLSRLLAYSPIMARLLLAATNRELQRIVDERSIVDDAEARSQWIALMTTKWVTIRMEIEHRRFRQIGDGDDCERLPDIDYAAVAGNRWRWRTAFETKTCEGLRNLYDKGYSVEMEVH